MKYLIIALLLAGCSTTIPVTQKFPEAPKELISQCSELKGIEEGETKLSAVLSVVTHNYSLYHECSLKNELWIEWYKSQKKIYENVK